MSDALDPRVAARIGQLDLAPHPEGGFYRETHRSGLVLPQTMLPDYPGDRVAMTSILFLLPAGHHSRWHRVRSEELWLFQEGDPLRLRMRRELGAASDEDERRLGPGGGLQVCVRPGWWQSAEALDGPAGYALVGCVVAPGFDFEDFEVIETK